MLSTSKRCLFVAKLSVSSLVIPVLEIRIPCVLSLLVVVRIVAGGLMVDVIEFKVRLIVVPSLVTTTVVEDDDEVIVDVS